MNKLDKDISAIDKRNQIAYTNLQYLFMTTKILTNNSILDPYITTIINYNNACKLYKQVNPEFECKHENDLRKLSVKEIIQLVDTMEQLTVVKAAVNIDVENKYLKYKQKYLILKQNIKNR